MNRISLTLTFMLSLNLIACEGSYADAPTGDSMVLSSQALRLNASPLDLVGVAVDPMTGSRFVLDRDNQLYDLSAQGHVTPRLDLQEIWGADPMQDLCAVSDSEIFTVAPGFGIKVNLDTSEAQSHFCLEPEDVPGQMNDWDAWRHETHAIACDLESALIYGQPQTLPRDDENGAPVRSEVSLYDLPSGEDIGWYPLPSELFIAGGMVVIDEMILLGRGSTISSYDLWSGALEPVVDLAHRGLTRIEGLAYDAQRGELLAIDGADSQLFTLDFEVIRGAF